MDQERGMSDEDWPMFTFSYALDGKFWSFNLPARDFEDAARRVRAIGLSGQVDGRLVGSCVARAWDERAGLPVSGLLN